MIRISNIEEQINELTRDENGNVKDNLLIKGDNLEVLRAIKNDFKGKVKLIYIDPPYNTGKNRLYKDRFDSDNWLTFMKARLEIAKELLTDDGAIFVSIDDNEQAYLKVLMDEIFGRKNFISTLIIKSIPNGRSYGSISRTHDYIHIYGISNKVKLNAMIDIDRKFRYNDDISEFNILSLHNGHDDFNPNNRPNLFYPFYVNTKKLIDGKFYEISLEKKPDFIEVYPPKSSNNTQLVWRWGKEKSLENLNINLVANKFKNQYKIVSKLRLTDKRLKSIVDDSKVSTRVGSYELKQLFNSKKFAFPKPEVLLEKIITISTQPGDIVLDFFAGSGTTGAVAHKMGRQWVMIEQMDYIDDITKKRMIKVIEGEQGGISESVNWQGGGNFVYIEKIF